MRNITYILTVALIVVFTFSPAVGQTPVLASFINPSNITWESLSAKQQQWVSKLQNNPFNSSLQFVEIGDIPSIQVNGWMDLQIPGKDCTARLRAKHVESSESGDFFWYGEVINDDTPSQESCSCYDGSVNILKKDGQLIGTIKIDEDSYELHDLGENKSVLVKKSSVNNLPRCGNIESGDSLITESLPSAERGEGNCPVKVLALYSQAAENAVDDILNTIHLTIYQTNQALRNSDIEESDLKLSLVGVEKLDDVSDNGFINSVFQTLYSEPTNSIWRQMRADAHADIVLFFGQSYFGSGPEWTYGELGKAGTLTLDSEYAIAIIAVQAALDNYTGAHEIAHLFGCRHEIESDGEGDYEHAHSFRTGCWPWRTNRKTILWSTNVNNTIQHFSNPNVSYKGEPTGSESANNANKLRESACTVANFTEDASIPTLTTSISGPSEGCTCQFVDLEGVVHGGANGIYTFQWYTSSDGFSWSVVQGTNSTFTFRLPCDLELASGTFVQFVATSVDGQVSHSFHYVKAEDYDLNRDCERSWINDDYENQIKIYPNPATDIVFFEEDIYSPQEVQLHLYNYLGELVAEHNQIAQIGEFSYPIHTKNLVSGIYILKVQLGTISKCFIVKKI